MELLAFGACFFVIVHLQELVVEWLEQSDGDRNDGN
jgi:hypothetical protein